MFYNCDRLYLKLQHQFQFWYSPLTLKLYAQSAIAFCLLTSGNAFAQVIPDNTLPQNSIVTPDGDIVEITGGTTSGTNLFHSFEEFSLNTGNTAFFDNAADINNIIGRVTGNNISDIDGLIRANGSADLFLINPNGIIFGENAALDIGGSFIGSTADSLKFTDGAEFSAVDPDASSLLTVSIPVGLQYGQENGDITVEGSGNNLFIDFDTFTVDRSDRSVGLEVQPEKTLALVGGNVFIEGGNLTAPRGNIELGSVAGGTVGLTPDDLGWKLGYDSVSDFQEVALSQAASLEASGNSGGRVNVKGSFVKITDGSAILTDTLGNGSGGSLTIEADETEIYGAAENGFTSSLFTNVDLDATGDGGDALIDTEYLYIGDGAQVNVNTFGLGNAGTLTVNAGDIEILGGSIDGELPSGLFAQADIGQTGTGGNIDIEADYLLVADGAQINVNTFGEADAGNLTVRASEIELIAGSADFGSSGLFASSEDLGNGGNISVESDYLLVADGAQIVSSAFFEGDAGSLSVNSSEIELIGTSPGGTPSGLFANSEDLGNGGNISVESDYLLVADGAQIVSSAFFEGDAGNLSVDSSEIELIGTSPGGTPSGLFSTVEEDAIGNGGNISVATEELVVSEGAQIAVSTLGLGNAGSLNIEAGNVELSGSKDLRPSGLFSNAIIGSGDGGDLNLTSDRLTIIDGATISAGNFSSSNSEIPPGTGAAGSISIDVNSLELDSTVAEKFSTITAAAFAQAGGDITLNVNSNLSLSNGSQITAETRGDGNGGSIDISTNKFNLNSQSQVSVNSTGLGQAGDIAIASDSLTLNTGKITATSIQTGGGEISLATDSLLLNNNSLVSTSVLDSTGGGGNIAIDNEGFIIGRNNSKIEADAVFGQGGNIQITATGLFFDASSQITASSEFGVDGIVEINDLESNKRLNVVSLPQIVSTQDAVIISSCPVPEQNIFAVTGLGGIPENPSSYLKGRTLWQDARRLTNYADANRVPNSTSSSSQLRKTTKEQAIVESQGWIVNQRGNIELIAATTPQIGQQQIRCGDL